jgi:hypothetical protein
MTGPRPGSRVLETSCGRKDGTSITPNLEVLGRGDVNCNGVFMPI